MPVLALQQMIGKNGTELWRKANGIDETPVIPYSERKSISKEHTFSNDTMDVFAIRSLISGMAEELAYQLRKEKWLTSTVVIKIRYANFDTETKQCKVAYTAADHTLSRIAKDLFNKIYTRRMRLRLVGLRFTGLVHGSHQMNLFEDTEELMNLYQTMDRIKNRFGADAVRRASGFDFSDGTADAPKIYK